MNIFILIILIWSLGGVIWALIHDIESHEVIQYTKLTIFIGGPIWWMMGSLTLIVNKIKKLNLPSIKPKKKEES